MAACRGSKRMDRDRPLRLEVLINSPGPHDQVRMREPFRALKAKGIDCRLHERPFRLGQCIRAHSMVIWQRPLPETWTLRLEQLRWMRERGCLLLTEWDDHPSLFSDAVQGRLKELRQAPLTLCHALHSSTPALCTALRAFNPISLAFDNGVPWIPPFDAERHQPSGTFRVLLGNQNRYLEHRHLKQALIHWIQTNPNVQLVVIGDPSLANQLRAVVDQHQLIQLPLLDYYEYRGVMRQCHLSMLPLLPSLGNRCKTVIKWVECAAESVVCVAGPELYGSVIDGRNGLLVKTLDELIPTAQRLLEASRERQVIAQQAHHQVTHQWQLSQLLPHRLWLYQQLWRKRDAVDRALLQRWPEAATETPFPL